MKMIKTFCRILFEQLFATSQKEPRAKSTRICPTWGMVFAKESAKLYPMAGRMESKPSRATQRDGIHVLSKTIVYARSFSELLL